MTLLEPHITQVGQPEGSGTDDRLTDAVAAGTPRELRDALAGLIGEEEVHGRAIDLVRYASDASPLHPELVRSATREEAAYASEHPADLYLSANRTCEMGLLHATGRPYESFLFELEASTRPQTQA